MPHTNPCRLEAVPVLARIHPYTSYLGLEVRLPIPGKHDLMVVPVFQNQHLHFLFCCLLQSRTIRHDDSYRRVHHK